MAPTSARPLLSDDDVVAQTGQAMSSDVMKPVIGDSPDVVGDSEVVEVIRRACCESNGRVSMVPIAMPTADDGTNIAASNHSGCNTAAANPRPVRTRHCSSPAPRLVSRVPLPPATAAATTDESKFDLAIMACNLTLLVPVVLNVKDLTMSWETVWIVLYVILMVLSIVSTVTGFFTAAVSWATRFSSFCARIGLLAAAALFVVFIACKLGRFGCAAGVACAATVVLILVVVWILSEKQPTDRAQPAAERSLPNDAP